VQAADSRWSAFRQPKCCFKGCLMKIVCPSCEAQYEVPEMVLTSRRKMRCARCATQWVPADAVAAAAAPVTETDGPFAAALGLSPQDDGNVPVEEEPVLALAVPVYDFEPEPEPVVEPAPRPADPVTPVALRPEMAVAPVSLSPGPVRAPHEVVVPPPRPGPPVAAWGGSIAVLVVALAAAVIFRAPVMKAWPPSARLYAGLGLGDR
jgi:predicted Zn finger-like uncharacterized protein